MKEETFAKICGVAFAIYVIAVVVALCCMP